MLYLCFTPLENCSVTANTVQAPYTSAPASPPGPELTAGLQQRRGAGLPWARHAQILVLPTRFRHTQVLVLPDARFPAEEGIMLAPAAQRGPGTFSSLRDCGAGPVLGDSVPLATEDELGVLQCVLPGGREEQVGGHNAPQDAQTRGKARSAGSRTSSLFMSTCRKWPRIPERAASSVCSDGCMRCSHF